MNKGLFRLLYVFGVFVTLIAAGIVIWPDFESRNFSQTFRGDSSAPVRCPIAITAGETSSVRLTIDNPLQRRARFVALSFITNGNTTVPDEVRQETYVEAGESETLEWSIDESNSAYSFMVLARIYQFRSGSAPSKSAACGVWLFGSGWAQSLGVSGDTIFWSLAVIGLVSLIAGGVGASETENPLALVSKRTGKPRAGVVGTAILVLGLVLGLLAIPMAALVVLMLGALLMFGLIDYGGNTVGY